MPRTLPEGLEPPDGVWAHFKGGLYNVFGLAMDQSAQGHEEPLVLYKPVGGVHDEHTHFDVRLLSEFTDRVPDPKDPSKTVPRFRKM